MPPFTHTLHTLHSHRAVILIVATTLAAAAIARRIAVLTYREDCARAGRRRSSPRFDGRRRR